MRVRFGLGILLGLTGVSAIGGALYGLAGARGIPLEWLSNSPFSTYVVPSVILLLVAAYCLFAAVAVIAHQRVSPQAAMVAGVILLGWIVAQLAIIGFVSWLQPVIVLTGVSVVGLAWWLPK